MNPQPDAVDQLFADGNRRMAAGDLPAAEACFRSALRMAPDCAEVHANLGLLLERRGAPRAAELQYRRSIALVSGYPDVHLNLGALLANAMRFEDAEAAYRTALALNPRYPAGWSNLGALYACMKREEEAEQCYRKAMDLDPDYAAARFNLSYVLLRQGRFEEGWRCLESRNWNAGLAAKLTCPRWQGETLIGKSLLISCEAGHGDMIQFCRYAAVLKARGAARIGILCHPPLKALLATLNGVDEVFAIDETIPESGWDYWVAPFSLPHYCDTRVDSIPAAIPYLEAQPERTAKFAAMLPDEGVRVGLVWRGSPQFENDMERSIHGLERLVPLGAVAGVHLISLQKGAGEAEAAQPPAGLSVIDLGSRIEDFADAAAIVACLDLVICVDTAVAHLAGALGKPCWVMLPHYKTDWRWLTGRTDSPWYPDAMRLFRQAETGGWDAVIADVVVALEQFVRARPVSMSDTTAPGAPAQGDRRAALAGP